MRHLSLILIILGAVLAGGYWFARAQAENCRETEFWRCGADMPTPRSEIQAAVADGRIYVAGGFAMGSRIVAAFEAYDLQTDSWERLAPLPRRIHHAALAALDGRVYLSGGYRGLNMSVGTTELAVFDPAENRWQALADMPAPRVAHVMVALGDHLYVLGGITEDLASV